MPLSGSDWWLWLGLKSECVGCAKKFSGLCTKEFMV